MNFCSPITKGILFSFHSCTYTYGRVSTHTHTHNSEELLALTYPIRLSFCICQMSGKLRGEHLKAYTAHLSLLRAPLLQDEQLRFQNSGGRVCSCQLCPDSPLLVSLNSVVYNSSQSTQTAGVQ